MLLMTLHVILGSFFHTLMIQVVVNDQNFNANNGNFRNSFNPKEVQMILNSIDDKLRNLERVHVFRHKLRNDNYFIEQLEKFDQRLTSFENRIETKFDKFLESVSNRNLKDDIVKDHQNRKIDLIYEKINHRIGFGEAKLETSFANLQNNLKSSNDKMVKNLEKLETNFETRQVDVESDLNLAMNFMEDIRIQLLEEKLMNFSTEIVKATIEQLDTKITQHLTEIQQKSQMNFDLKKGSYLEEITDSANLEFEPAFHKYSNKRIDTDSNLWKKVDKIENLIRISMTLTNLTRREIHHNYKSLFHRFGILQQKMHSNNSYENCLETLIGRIEHKLTEFKTGFNTDLNAIIFHQKLFLENCHRIQSNEQQLDSKIYVVLEKLLDMFINNTSGNHFELKRLNQALEDHDSDIKDIFNEGTRKILANLSTYQNSTIKKPLNVITDFKSNQPADFIEKLNKKLDNVREQMQQIEIDVKDFNFSKATNDSADMSTKLKGIMSRLDVLNRSLSVIKNIDNENDVEADRDPNSDSDTDHEADPESDYDYIN